MTPPDLTELRARLRDLASYTGIEDIRVARVDVVALLDALEAAEAVAKSGADEMALAHEWRRRAEEAEERAAKAEATLADLDAQCGHELWPGESCIDIEEKDTIQWREAIASLRARLATAREALRHLSNEACGTPFSCARAALAATADKGEGEGGDGV